MNKDLLVRVSRVVDSVRVTDSNKKLEEYLLGSLRASGLETMVNVEEHEDGYRVSEQGNKFAYADVYLDGTDTLVAGRSRMAQGLNGWAVNGYAEFAGISREQARAEAERLFAWFADLEALSGRPVEALKDLKVTDAKTPPRQGIEDAAEGNPMVEGIEFAPENLTGHGGTEIDGNWYYTWEQAMAAAKELGDGWRLPTQAELRVLKIEEGTFDDERRGRWFGNTLKDQPGDLFLPAAGLISHEGGRVEGRLSKGAYWGKNMARGYNDKAIAFDFGIENYSVGTIYAPISEAYSVRLVR